MACAGCSTSKDGTPSGCGNKGGCLSGGCNKLNTYDWLVDINLPEHEEFDLVEVSFKNGSRKTFFHNPQNIRAQLGDMVAVEAKTGYDIGKVSLTGELVRLQMKKKRVRAKTVFGKIIRLAHDRDMERLEEARSMEKGTMIKSRVIARSLDLKMKIGDVEYQGDKRKATFYYTADGRVDFRELIRHYAREFKVKIEMRQIGARQETARIGGLGACGRELCCSTWLTNFKTVTTSAARYQNLAINQTKLSGQCGRLKCCLNYELDTYMEALKAFPKRADYLHTVAGDAVMVKMDIFKQLMFYAYKNNSKTKGKLFALKIDRVNEILAMNKRGEKPEELQGIAINDDSSEAELDFADVTGQIELPEEKKRSRRRKRPNKGGRPKGSNQRQNRQGQKQNNKPKDKTDNTSTNKDNNKDKDNRTGGRNNKPRNNRNRNNRNRRKDNRNNRPPNKDKNSGGNNNKED